MAFGWGSVDERAGRAGTRTHGRRGGRAQRSGGFPHRPQNCEGLSLEELGSSLGQRRGWAAQELLGAQVGAGRSVRAAEVSVVRVKSRGQKSKGDERAAHRRATRRRSRRIRATWPSRRIAPSANAATPWVSLRAVSIMARIVVPPAGTAPRTCLSRLFRSAV